MLYLYMYSHIIYVFLNLIDTKNLTNDTSINIDKVNSIKKTVLQMTQQHVLKKDKKYTCNYNEVFTALAEIIDDVTQKYNNIYDKLFSTLGNVTSTYIREYTTIEIKKK